MKKLYFLALLLTPILANAQMKTWENFSYDEIDHPFKNTYVDPPANNIDSKGNKWVLNSRSIWKINGTDTTKFTDFPTTNTTNRNNSMLSILDDQVVFYHYRYDRVNNVNRYTNYLGYYNGTEMKFFSETSMNTGVSTSNFTDIKQTDKYIWITKKDKLISFDKNNTFKSYNSTNSIIKESTSNAKLHRYEPDEIILENNYSNLYTFKDQIGAWEKLLPSDSILRYSMSNSTKTVYIAGEQKIYSYFNKTLQSFDVSNLENLGKPEYIKEFTKNTFVTNYEKGFVLIDNGQVYVEYYENYINEGLTSLFYAIPSYLDNGILVLSVPVEDGEKMFFSFYNNKIEFEGLKTANYYNSDLFFYKTLTGSAYFYSTETDYSSYPYSRTLFVVKNDKDTFSIALPSEVYDITTGISVDSNYVWIRDSLVHTGIIKIRRMKKDQYFVKGNLFYDNNKNGQKESTEVGISKYPVRINPLGLIVYPDRDGNFAFAGVPGERYTMELPDAALFDYTSKPLPYTFIESENNQLGVTLANPTPEIRTNFITPWPRCGTTGTTTLQIANVGFESIDKVQFVLISDPLVEVNSTEALEKKADTLVFELNNLLPLKPQSLSYEVTFPGGEMTGQKLTFQLLSSIYDNGIIVKSEADSISTIVRCSFDPNDKAVTPAGIADDHFTLKNSTLSYLIRFENTGNDTAYTVTVYDTLDVNMDLSTFEVLGSSHKVITELSKEGVLIFHFEDIMLPDNKTDLENAQGFVRFAIKPKTGLAENTVVKNKAGIVFDSNIPVITNETFNNLVTTLPVLTAISAITENKNLIYPNPATNMVYIADANTAKVEVYDFTGRKINTFGNQEINTSTWKKGFYLFRMFDGKGNSLSSEKVLITKQ